MWNRCLEWDQSGAGEYGRGGCCGVVVGAFGVYLCQRRCSSDPCAPVVASSFFSHGAGTQFPRNTRAEDVLAELAAELIRLEDRDHGTD